MQTLVQSCLLAPLSCPAEHRHARTFCWLQVCQAVWQTYRADFQGDLFAANSQLRYLRDPAARLLDAVPNTSAPCR